MLKDKKKKLYIGAGVLILIGIVIILCLLLCFQSGNGEGTEDITISDDVTIKEDGNDDVTIKEDGIDDVTIKEDGNIDKQEKVVLDLRLDRDITMMEMAFGEEETPGYLKKVGKLRSYEILEATHEEDVIYATVLVKAPDLYTITKNLQVEGELTEEKIDAALMEALEDAVIVENEVELIYQKVEGEWESVMTEEFVDAYTGGLLRLQDEYYNEILGGSTNED